MLHVDMLLIDPHLRKTMMKATAVFMKIVLEPRRTLKQGPTKRSTKI